MQPHDLHQHLVGVGRAVERAGAGAMVGPGFGFEQRVASDLALGIELAHLGLLLVAHARGHRPAGNEDRRQMTKRERAEDQAGHDLVAHAQIQGGVEHLVRQRHRGGKRDHVAGEQGQVHALLPCVTPSHIAGTPPANCAVAPASRAACLSQRGKASNG